MLAYKASVVTESIPDELKRKFDTMSTMYHNVTIEDLEKLCRAVVFKTFCNFQNGQSMIPSDAPTVAENDCHKLMLFVPEYSSVYDYQFLGSQAEKVEVGGLTYCEAPYITAPLKVNVRLPLLAMTSNPSLHQRGTLISEQKIGRVFIRGIRFAGVEEFMTPTPTLLEVTEAGAVFELLITRDGAATKERYVFELHRFENGDVGVYHRSEPFSTTVVAVDLCFERVIPERKTRLYLQNNQVGNILGIAAVCGLWFSPCDVVGELVVAELITGDKTTVEVNPVVLSDGVYDYQLEARVTGEKYTLSVVKFDRQTGTVQLVVEGPQRVELISLFAKMSNPNLEGEKK